MTVCAGFIESNNYLIPVDGILKIERCGNSIYIYFRNGPASSSVEQFDNAERAKDRWRQLKQLLGAQ